jgi:urease beta subunit
MKPGEYLLETASGPIQAYPGRRTLLIRVQNTGDRPIQVGSHFHFFEANRALRFDRSEAFGMHLNIASGTAVRFEPGEEKEVALTDFAGKRLIFGFNGLVGGPLDEPQARVRALERALRAEFQSSQQ